MEDARWPSFGTSPKPVPCRSPELTLTLRLGQPMDNFRIVAIRKRVCLLVGEQRPANSWLTSMASQCLRKRRQDRLSQQTATYSSDAKILSVLDSSMV